MQTCLVIDEFAVVRKVASRILTLSGYNPLVADTLEGAIGMIAEAGTVDIVVVSATLPDASVEDAVRRVRQEPGASRAIVLASLVEANLGLMTRAKRAGALGFIYRPFDRESLTGWLRAYAPAEDAKTREPA
jgi:two-component system, chemotaxis family, chemotaxis protein CheY